MKFKTIFLAASLILFGGGLCGSPAIAVTLQNDGFETGSDTGWSNSGWVVRNTLGYPFFDVAYRGQYSAWAMGAPAYLGQAFLTNVGSIYDLSFAYDPGPIGGSELLVLWQGVQVADLVGGNKGWTVFHFGNLLATDPITALIFFSIGTPFVGLDNIRVETPIPAALPLFASGLGVLGLLNWRRKRKASAAIAA
jgi:hypothetical protein